MFRLTILLALVLSVFATQNDQVKNVITDDIQHHKVMVYSKTYCSYSQRLKKILSEFHIPDMKIVELDRRNEMNDMQDVLYDLSGRKTVPQLFIDGHFVGGHDETKKIVKEGKFMDLLLRAHAI